MTVTETRLDGPPFEVSDPIPEDDAYFVVLALRDYPDHVGWEGDRPSPVRTIRAGQTLIADLKRRPSVLLDKPLHTIHFYLPRTTIDAIADDAGARRIDDLRYRPGAPVDDPVICGLGTAMRRHLAHPQEADRLFIDHVMTAAATHVARTYGGMHPGSRPARGGLAGWQERRAKELLAADLAGDTSLRDVAAACGISTGHFFRAFRESTGLAPHQWLLRRRVEAAMALMSDRRLSLAEVALSCGFADQSHFTRVFARLVGTSPGAWRRDLEIAGPDAPGDAGRG